ncbi:MAG: glycosyltransferase family 2 protein, partial [bacterium]
MNTNICILMVSHNDLSEECLKSIVEARNHSTLKTTLVVIDNASKKYQANEFVDRFIPDAIVLLRNGDFGFGRSNNRGAREVEAEYYFILNPDTVLTDPDILNKFYNYMKTNPEVGLLAPKIFYMDGRLQETCRRFPKWYMPFVQRSSLVRTAFGQGYAASFVMKDYDHESSKDVDWVQGSAMFVDGQVWRQLEGFDDRYWLYFEDIDFCRRVHLLGKQVLYNPAMTLKHAHGKESAAYSNLIVNLMKKKEARGHIASWLKYSWKWAGQTEPIVGAASNDVTLSVAEGSRTSGGDIVWPRVAITYLTYNGPESYHDITRCLKSIQVADYPLDKLEVNCVENPSPSGASWPFIEKEWLPLSEKSFP